jgi:hypothetical protein
MQPEESSCVWMIGRKKSMSLCIPGSFAWKLGDDAASSRAWDDGRNNRSWYSPEACRRSDVLMP